jgi:hypothetical protein
VLQHLNLVLGWWDRAQSTEHSESADSRQHTASENLALDSSRRICRLTPTHPLPTGTRSRRRRRTPVDCNNYSTTTVHLHYSEPPNRDYALYFY